MSHEDVILIAKAIDGVAASLTFIAIVIGVIATIKLFRD